jgi:lipopolysaccharide/colanic/teichoic acid biosynthesis glycosyltransferase
VEKEIEKMVAKWFTLRNISVSVMLSFKNAMLKRSFDLIMAALGLLFLWWIILLGWVCAYFDTGAGGFFIQQRVGRYGRLFSVIKLRTMRPDNSMKTTITTDSDSRITNTGRILRRLKIDELPQLINVILGDMSFVGPRPDVPGYADLLDGDDRIILNIRPGITGPATLTYKDEDSLLAGEMDPEAYSRQVIWPDKVRINKDYMKNWSFRKDISYIIQTIFDKIIC